MSDIILEMKNITKDFSGVKALNNVNLKVKKGEQPWTIRPGQEWKEKIIGRAQKTGTTGHDVRSYRIAIREAKKAETDAVLLNRGMK